MGNDDPGRSDAMLLAQRRDLGVVQQRPGDSAFQGKDIGGLLVGRFKDRLGLTRPAATHSDDQDQEPGCRLSPLARRSNGVRSHASSPLRSSNSMERNVPIGQPW